MSGESICVKDDDGDLIELWQDAGGGFVLTASDGDRLPEAAVEVKVSAEAIEALATWVSARAGARAEA